jgi:hypothetical protein
MADHAVVGPDRQPLDVPGAHQVLAGLRLGVPAVLPQRLHQPGQLRGRGHISDEHSAGHQGGRCRGHAFPGGEQVEDDRVERLLGRQPVHHRAGSEPPRRMIRTQPPRDIVLGDLGEVLAELVGGDVAGVSDGLQQGDGERTGAGTGLRHPRSGEEVGQRDDRGGVLRIDDGGAALHRQHEVAQHRAQAEVGGAATAGDDDPLGPADDLVVLQPPLVGEEPLPRLQREGVMAPLRVGELHQVTDGERLAPSVVAGRGWNGHVGQSSRCASRPRLLGGPR